jgi:lipopolysaccharide/colanic/teichoic acid biosynthesis glycosyltransferase
MKRVFDVVVAALGLLVIWPLLVAIAIAIRLDGPGPVFFRGVRSGRGGVPFRIFKFRTMVPDAERIGGGSTAQDDPRVTALGQRLRRHKLDELPQLFNVLRGDMSLVGPRPELPQYTERYGDDERLILSVRPGITDPASLHFIDLAEVLGSEDADRVYEEKVLATKNRLRLAYVRERSFAGDLFILVQTVLAVLGVRWRGGAHGGAKAADVLYSER